MAIFIYKEYKVEPQRFIYYLMKISTKERDHIKDSFQKLENRMDLLDLLNYVKRIYLSDKYVPFEIKQLTYYSNPRKALRYKTFKIAKKNGGQRIIAAPVKGLKLIQRCLNIIFQIVYTPHKSATGFVAGRSIYENALRHVNSNFILNIDLKDFFLSIDQARVWKRIQLPPFNLGTSENRLKLANIIAALCCTNLLVRRKNERDEWEEKKQNVLPQGAPTSPLISNAICEKLDIKLTALSKRFGLKYSRYADDITFSSMHFVYNEKSGFLEELYRIIIEQGFTINDKKFRIQTIGHRQEVTGLIVSHKVNVKREYIKNLRQILYYWETYGLEKANNIFKENYANEKGHIKNLENQMQSIIEGKLNFLSAIRGKDDNCYNKLKTRFNKLIQELEGENLSGYLDKDSEKYRNKSFNAPIIHSPQSLVKLLSKFSENNSALKYATHSWESGVMDGQFTSYKNFKEKLNIEFKEISSDLRTLNYKLWSKIYSFLLLENQNGQYSRKGQLTPYSWGTHGLNIGWSSVELEKWCEKNPGRDPYDYPLHEKRIFDRTQLSQFSQVVDIFKNEIEIRTEGNKLERIFIDLRKKHLGGDFVTPNYIGLKQLSFYTDVDLLTKGLNKIFREIGKRTNFPNVTISAENKINLGLVEISILQHKSYNLQLTSDEMISSIQSGDFGDIAGWFNNICDWSVESRFKDGNFRINFLTSNKKDPAKKGTDNVQGFTHILRFYKR
ncbi:reverse transcriptase domain-containing protein [Chitinophaga sp.]|uniref:reverse transcriptase domain-containing protein n=1 Tax=Chitinophaga sp. TaxID=1869181 RepID=UPI0031D22CBF